MIRFPGSTIDIRHFGEGDVPGTDLRADNNALFNTVADMVETAIGNDREPVGIIRQVEYLVAHRNREDETALVHPPDRFLDLASGRAGTSRTFARAMPVFVRANALIEVRPDEIKSSSGSIVVPRYRSGHGTAGVCSPRSQASPRRPSSPGCHSSGKHRP